MASDSHCELIGSLEREWRDALCAKDIDKLRAADRIYQGHLQTVASTAYEVERAVLDADLVIGAVLVPAGDNPWRHSIRPGWANGCKPCASLRRRSPMCRKSGFEKNE